MMALTESETLRRLLRENPDEGLRVLEHDLFGMISVIQGGALLLSEDLQQPIADVMSKMETLQQIADLILREAMNAQAYLEALQATKKAAEQGRGGEG